MRANAVMLLIALFFALWAMRGAAGSDVTYHDEARHAMNGVLMLDMFSDGALLNPVEYVRRYFARYPAISIPYHPPLFPAVEAVFYALFGVSHHSARLAVACFVFGAAALLFRLVFKLHNSILVAATTVILFFSVPLSQYLAADVMLEIPAMFFVTATMLLLVPLRTDWELGRAVGAGACAAAAIWTKQAIFVALVPVFIIVAKRQWQSLRSISLWAYMTVCGASAVALAALWATAGLTGFARHWSQSGLAERMLRNLAHYGSYLIRPEVMAPAVIVILLGTLAIGKGWIVRGSMVPSVYVAWIMAVLAVLLIVPAYDQRYLWFAYPPAIALGISILDTAAGRFSPTVVRRSAFLAMAVLFFLWKADTRIPALTGPSHVANELASLRPRRVLVAAASNGSIIFSLRSMHKEAGITVLRADKLDSTVFQPRDFEDFAHRFGLDAIVLEDAPESPWAHLVHSPTVNMQLHEVVDQDAPFAHWRSKLMVYRYLNPSPSPQSSLTIPLEASGKRLDLEF